MESVQFQRKYSEEYQKRNNFHQVYGFLFVHDFYFYCSATCDEMITTNAYTLVTTTIPARLKRSLTRLLGKFFGTQ